MPRRLGAFFAELRRRHVYQVAAVYVAVGLGVLGAAELILDPLGLGAARPFIVVITLLGFPIAVVLAWAYEKTPEGIVRDAPETASEEPTAESVAPAAVSVEEERKSIVVLPFDNMSPDPNDAYFSDGLTEEIITQLSYLKSLRVISRNSSMVLKNTKKDTRAIGRELGVQYVMEGSVRKAGSDLRITAQLIDAATDEHIWAETYARELENVFEIQADIALSVADAMKASLDPHAVERIKNPPTESLAAHDAYLRGWQNMWLATEDGLKAAKRHFDRAVGLDPDYALAHAGLATWYMWAGGSIQGLMPAADAIPEARQEVDIALSLDPDLGDAYATLAWLEGAYASNWEKARQAIEEAVQRSPGSQWAWYIYAVVIGVLGQEQECFEAVDRVLELDPLSVQSYTAAAFSHCIWGRLDEALEYANRCEELDPGIVGVFQKVLVLQSMGEDEKAMKTLLHVQGQWGSIRDSTGAWVLAYALGRDGRREEFDELTSHMETRVSEGRASWTALALAYMGVEEHERALSYFERAPDQRPPGSDQTAWAGMWPHFAPIRNNPRFQAVLTRLGLPTQSHA